VKTGIARHLSLGLAVVQLLALGTVAVLVTARLERELVSRVGDGAVESASALEAVLREDMVENRREALRRGLDAVRRRVDLLAVRILDHRGVVAVSSDPREAGEIRPRDGPGCGSCHAAPIGPGRTADGAILTRMESSRTLRAVKPILNGPGCVAGCHAHRSDQSVLGFLEVDRSLVPVDRTISKTRIVIALITLAAVVLTILASHLLVVRRIQRPVGDLVTATEHVAAGDLTWRVPPQRDPEFGRIGAAFDRMSEKIEEAQRQVILTEKLASAGKLAAGVAHELNNPLTGILAFAEDLRAHAGPDDPRRADYDVIIHETRRCGNIVHDLLDFARQEAPERRETDLNQVIARAIALVEHQAAFHLVRFALELDPRLPPVLADPGQIQQVFLNLITNAADAMQNGGTIAIATRAVEGPAVEASVADTGTGIPEAIRHRIFEPFFSTKRQNGSSEHQSGQGLGLAVSWSIVERHGGRISVESAVGRGTTFFVRFPARPRKGEAP